MRRIHILLILVVDGAQAFQLGTLLLVAQQWDIVVEGVEEALGLSGLLRSGHIWRLLVDIGLLLLLGGLVATLLLVFGGIGIRIVASSGGQLAPQLEVLLLGLENGRCLGGGLLQMSRAVVLHMEAGLVRVVVGNKVTAMGLDVLVGAGHLSGLVALLVLALVPVPVAVGELAQTVLAVVLVGVVVLLHVVLGMLDHPAHVHELALLVAGLWQGVLSGLRGILDVANATQLGAVQELLSLLRADVNFEDVLAASQGGLKIRTIEEQIIISKN